MVGGQGQVVRMAAGNTNLIYRKQPGSPLNVAKGMSAHRGRQARSFLKGDSRIPFHHCCLIQTNKPTTFAFSSHRIT